eukprot:maker-scaffold_29-snap-gene-4.5-mRNA-1 protein AED:0.01 eAED:0.01 QI:124/1/1/1/1/1/2/249/594
MLFQVFLLVLIVSVILFVGKATVFKAPAPQGLKLPPVYSTGAPFFGNIAAFVSSPLGFIRQAKDEVGGIFTLNFLAEQCTFLIGAKYHSPFFEGTDVDMDQASVYQFMTPIFGKNVVYDAGLVERRQQIRLLGSALKPSVLRTYPAVIARETSEYLRQHWGSKGKIDLLPAMAELIILTASATLLGPEVRNELFKEVSELYEMLDKGLTPLSVFFPWLPISPHRKRDLARKEIGELFSRVIRNRRENLEESGKYTDMLQKLIEFKYKDGREISEEEITGLLIATMFAGQHTSSITTTWSLLFLLRDLQENNGANYNKVMTELANLETVEDGFVSGKCLDWAAISQEKELHNCVKESIRLHPPLILLMRRVMKATTTPDGYFIPKGHRVIVSNAVAQRLPEVFEESDKWIPDRWNEFNSAKLPKYSFIGFGAGVHTCMGESFAFMQIKTILTVILSKYEMELCGNFPEANYEAMVVPPKGPNFVKYKLRKEGLKPYRTDDVVVEKVRNIKVVEVEEGKKHFTRDEVAKHNTRNDLWIIVKEKVYDVTSYIDLHQGGDEAILKYGGKDATVGVYGPQHPGTVPTLLERYLVGELIN